MIKTVLFLAAVLTGTLQSSAQAVALNTAKITVTAGPFVSDIVQADEWYTQSGQSFTKAKYAAFESEASVKLLGPQTNLVTLTFDVDVEEGELEVFILDDKGWVQFRKTFTKSEKAEMQVSLAANQEYDLQFVGRKTSGSYLCKWTEQS